MSKKQYTGARISRQKKQLILEAYLKGASTKEVAQLFGCASETVRGVVVESGHSLRRNPRDREYHTLTNIDEIKKTAICAICGPVEIGKVSRPKGQKCSWRCNVRRAQLRKRDVKHRQNLAPKCERCGFEPEHSAQMDVHHKDHNHKNNTPENLQTLCANCHRLCHIGDGHWTRRKSG